MAELLRELSKMEQRYQAVFWVLAIHVDGLSVTEVAEKWGVSRQAVHTWLRRYEDAGLEGLADRSHRPETCPHHLPAVIEARVCELRRTHPFCGPVRIRPKLARDGVDPAPSQMGIRRAPVRHGLIDAKARRKKLVTYKRWARGRPMGAVAARTPRGSSLRLGLAPRAARPRWRAMGAFNCATRSSCARSLSGWDLRHYRSLRVQLIVGPS